jgi:hypothetical protein
MTNHNQTTRTGRANADRIAPAASLARISIERAARPARAMPSARTAPVTSPTFDHEISTPPITELRAEVSGPSPRKVFPSAKARNTGIIDAPVTSHVRVAPSAIIDLWEHLAANRLRPIMSDVDPITIAGQWPNSLLLRVTESGRRPGLEVAHMFVPQAGGPTSTIPIDAMTVDWIVGLGREVVITGEPVHETDAVPTGNGPISCGVIALPFGPEIGVDHVLCHLYRADERVIDVEVDGTLNLPPRDRTGIRRLFGR